MDEPVVSAALRERFDFLEEAIAWRGKLNRAELAQRFGMTTSNATLDLRKYCELYPDNLVYDHRSKTYVPGPNFKPGINAQNVGEDLYKIRALAASVASERPDVQKVGLLPEPDAHVSADVLYPLMRALNSSKRIEIRYQSLKDEKESSREIFPTQFVYAGVRWHIRAFDYSRQDYRDFVLARVLSIKPSQNDSSFVPEDSGWNTIEKIDVIPHPKAPLGAKRVIAREYGMKKIGEDYVLRVQIRRCLAPYYLRAHNLDLPKADYPHTTIVVKDFSKLEGLTFPS